MTNKFFKERTFPGSVPSLLKALTYPGFMPGLLTALIFPGLVPGSSYKNSRLTCNNALE